HWPSASSSDSRDPCTGSASRLCWVLGLRRPKNVDSFIIRRRSRQSSASMGARILSAALVLAGIVASGCTGVLGDSDEAEGRTPTGSGGSGGSGEAKPGYEPGDDPLELPKHRAWRLTPLQYERSFVAAFGSTVKTAQD